MDLRGIPMTSSVSYLQPSIVLEQTEPGFTVGETYPIFAMAIDNDTVKPYFLTTDDAGHFKPILADKVRRA